MYKKSLPLTHDEKVNAAMLGLRSVVQQIERDRVERYVAGKASKEFRLSFSFWSQELKCSLTVVPGLTPRQNNAAVEATNQNKTKIVSEITDSTQVLRISCEFCFTNCFSSCKIYRFRRGAVFK